MFTFIINVSPAPNLILLVFIFNDFTGVPTITLQVAFALPAFAVIIAEPFFKAVTVPFLFTDTTDGLLLVHVAFLEEFFTLSFKVLPFLSV